jgi:hypothetical protein
MFNNLKAIVTGEPSTIPNDIKPCKGIHQNSILFQRRLWYDENRNPLKGPLNITFKELPGNVPGSAFVGYPGSSQINEPTMYLSIMFLPAEGFSYKGVFYNPLSYAFDSSIVVGTNVGRTTRHELGHVMGMLHEHQNSKNRPFQINCTNVYEAYADSDCDNNASCTCPRNNDLCLADGFDLGGCCYLCSYSPAGCDDRECLKNAYEDAYVNVVQTFPDSADFVRSDYDADSVMGYSLPNNFIVGCEGVSGPCPNNVTKQVNEYSAGDIEALKRAYPPDSASKPQINVSIYDKRPAAYKVAWVNKIIEEELQPQIGIDFVLPEVPEYNALNFWILGGVMLVLFLAFLSVVLYSVFRGKRKEKSVEYEEVNSSSNESA